MLNTCASCILICSPVSFRTLGDIPSTPGYLLSFIYCLFCQLPLFGVTTNCPKLSRQVHRTLFVSGTCNELVSSVVNTELELKCIFIIADSQQSNSDVVLPEVSSVSNTQNKRFRCMWKRDRTLHAKNAATKRATQNA